MTNIERNFVVKKIKKYEKLSDDQKIEQIVVHLV